MTELKKIFCVRPGDQLAMERLDYWIHRHARGIFGIPEQSMYTMIGNGNNAKSWLLKWLKLVFGKFFSHSSLIFPLLKFL
jgi:hypothetical protein